MADLPPQPVIDLEPPRLVCRECNNHVGKIDDIVYHGPNFQILTKCYNVRGEMGENSTIEDIPNMADAVYIYCHCGRRLGWKFVTCRGGSHPAVREGNFLLISAMLRQHGPPQFFPHVQDVPEFEGVPYSAGVNPVGDAESTITGSSGDD